MRLVGLALLTLASCIEEKTTKVVAAPAPPSLEELAGDYVAEWGSMVSAVSIAGSGIAFDGYPCFVLSGQRELGGEFWYDPISGAFGFEVKTIGGDTKLSIAGAWGSLQYSVTFIGEPCAGGPLVLTEVQ